MKNKHIPSFNENTFTKLFQQFDEDAFFENLSNRIANKPYFEKYKGFKNTILSLSYLFNLASILTASYAIFWLTKWLTGFIVIAYIVAGVFLFFLEKLKRKSSNEFFQIFFFRKKLAVGWLVLSLFCLSISLVSSAFGTKTSTKELAPDANLIAADSSAIAYRQEIKKLEKANKGLSNQTNHEGIIYYKLQDIMRKNSVMISNYNARILELDKKLEGKNELLSTEYQQQVEITSLMLVWVTIILEVLFELCIAYIWYYYYRSYIERSAIKSFPQKINTQSKDLKKTLTKNEFEELKKEIETIRMMFLENKSIHSTPLVNESGGKENLNRKEFISNEMQKNPLGSHTARQLAEMGLGLVNTEKTPTRACTDVYTESLCDLHTVEHQYKKGGKTIIAHYTLPQIEARIAQYSRGVEDAISQALEKTVLDNRKTWLSYWEEKKDQLLNKVSL